MLPVAAGAWDCKTRFANSAGETAEGRAWIEGVGHVEAGRVARSGG
ncbi:MAG TPA: hypothetical protein VD788_03290 [Candidatus Polarisedimenticolaceae bacterium]|nr:hypothetical protein [Candidatus Polarisedimenticolaceae bacterium]